MCLTCVHPSYQKREKMNAEHCLYCELKFCLGIGGGTLGNQMFCDKRLLKTTLPMGLSLSLSLPIAPSCTNMPGHLQVLMKTASLENSSHLQSTLQLKRR